MQLPRDDPNKLFLNNGDKTFTDISQEAGVADERFARGFIYSDIDQDGDLDMLTVILRGFEADAHTKLYINQSDQSNNFIQFKLIGKESNRDAFWCESMAVCGGEKNIFKRNIRWRCQLCFSKYKYRSFWFRHNRGCG